VDLLAIGVDPAKPLSEKYVLSESIVLDAPVGGATYIAGTFTGSIDGANNEISGLSKPLFDKVSGEVKNLTLVTDVETLDVSGRAIGVSGGGALANKIEDGGNVSKVSVYGNVTGIQGENTITQESQLLYSGTEYVGGLTGWNSGTISEVHISGSVLGTSAWIGSVGGIAGLGLGDISNSTFSGTVTGERYVGGIVGGTASPTITNSSASGNVVGLAGGEGNIGGLVGGGNGNIVDSTANVNVTNHGVGYAGGLVGFIQLGSITNSHATGDVTGVGDKVGGLVGLLTGSELTGSSATGDVQGVNNIGGLVGSSEASYACPDTCRFIASEISSSSSSGRVTSSGSSVGGLVGAVLAGSITDSHSSSAVNSSGNYLGGLVGRVEPSVETSAVISRSFASGDVTRESNSSGWGFGGLIGKTNGQVTVENSYATGDVNIEHGSDVGGLIGSMYVSHTGSPIRVNNVAATGDVTGENWVGGVFGVVEITTYSWGGAGWVSIPEQNGTLTSISSFGDATATSQGAAGLIGVLWAAEIDGYRATGTVNEGSPDFIPTNQLVAYDAREPSSTYGEELSGAIFNPSDYISESTDNGGGDNNNGGGDNNNGGGDNNNGGGGNPAPDRPIRERIEREAREVAEARTSEKIEKVSGFKNETPLPKNALVAFVETTEKFDLAKVKAVDIAPTANVRVTAKTGEALQISLKSESKEPVELWVKSPDGSWLLAGVITFDKDGKAILPPLQFKNAGDYSLVLSKPTADSAKGSAPLDQTGSVLVAVS